MAVAMVNKRLTVDEFWDSCTPEPNSGCWLWTKCRFRNGYGNVKFGSTHKSASRVAWILLNGDPKHLDVLHRCDTPACINPDHLFIGTHSDNMKDMTLKGRRRGGASYRKTHCARGHELTTENLSIWKRHDRNYEHRMCRRCLLDGRQKIRDRKRGVNANDVQGDHERLTVFA